MMGKGSKTADKAQRKFFCAVFSYIMEKFELSNKSLADRMANYIENYGGVDESAVSGWKTRNPPRKKWKNAVCDAVHASLKESSLLEGHVRIEDFRSDMNDLLGAYGLMGLFERAFNERNYVDLICAVLKCSYEYGDRVPDADSDAVTADRRIRKLVVFDLDGTLIKGIKYSWTLLYQAAGVKPILCKEKKKDFENGVISYPEWVQFDFQELRGKLTYELAREATRQNCALTNNFRAAIERLKQNGCAVAIISGGADVVLYSLIPDADELFDGNIYINRLIFDSAGNLIEIRATPYDWDDDGKVRGVQGKNEGLKMLCDKYGLHLEDAVFVGDDDNDFKAMRLAGMKILYHSFDPNDTTYGTGSRSLPDGIKFVVVNDLMKVAKIILGEDE